MLTQIDERTAQRDAQEAEKGLAWFWSRIPGSSESQGGYYANHEDSAKGWGRSHFCETARICVERRDGSDKQLFDVARDDGYVMVTAHAAKSMLSADIANLIIASLPDSKHQQKLADIHRDYPAQWEDASGLAKRWCERRINEAAELRSPVEAEAV